MATCPFCRRGSLRIIAVITHEAMVTRILRHRKLAPVPPPMAPARSRQAAFDWVASLVKEPQTSQPSPGSRRRAWSRGRRACNGGGLLRGRHCCAFPPAAFHPRPPAGGPPLPRPAARVQPQGSSAAPPQPLLRGTPAGAAAPRERGRGHPRRGVAAGGCRWGFQEACSPGAGAKMRLFFLSAMRVVHRRPRYIVDWTPRVIGRLAGKSQVREIPLV